MHDKGSDWVISEQKLQSAPRQRTGFDLATGEVWLEKAVALPPCGKPGGQQGVAFGQRLQIRWPAVNRHGKGRGTRPRAAHDRLEIRGQESWLFENAIGSEI